MSGRPVHPRCKWRASLHTPAALFELVHISRRQRPGARVNNLARRRLVRTARYWGGGHHSEARHGYTCRAPWKRRRNRGNPSYEPGRGPSSCDTRHITESLKEARSGTVRITKVMIIEAFVCPPCNFYVFLLTV